MPQNKSPNAEQYYSEMVAFCFWTIMVAASLEITFYQ